MTFSQGPAIEAPVEIRLFGSEPGRLAQLAREAETTMTATPGIRDVDNPLRIERSALAVDVDEAKGMLLGVEPGSARQAVRLALGGTSPARLRDADGDDYPIPVQLPMAERHGMEALDAIYVPARDGAAMPLRALARPRIETGPARIDRYDGERVVSLTAYVQPGHLTGEVTAAALRRVEDRLTLPPGYRVALGGEAAEQRNSSFGMLAAALIAALGIAAVLVLEFGRFRLVAVVVAIVPLGVLGATTALWMTGNSRSFTALIGLIALVGIEIKNSILLVDLAEQLRRQGHEVREAVERAGQVRFLPVLLTSVTAIAGLLPLALGGTGLYAPLAIAIIGGMAVSTLLSRVAPPVAYLLLATRDAMSGGRP